jgi:hypothetical protein
LRVAEWGHADAVFQDQTAFTLWVYAVHPAAYLRLAGDIDSDARPALSRATAQLG